LGLTAEGCSVVGSFAPATTGEALAVAERTPACIHVVEVRLDAFEGTPDFASLRRAFTGKTLLATLRSRAEGGAFSGSREEMKRVLSQALAAGFDLVDVEWRGGEGRDLLGFDAPATVLSSHDHAGLPAALDSLCDGMLRTGARHVKIVGTAHDSRDALRLLAFQRRRADGRVSAFAMGEPGVATRILGPYLGAALSYGSLVSGRATAPGQVPAHDLCDLYGVGRRREVERVYALLAGFVSHSLSPAIHNGNFEAGGDPALYVPFALGSLLTEFDALVLGLDGCGLPLKGASVTIPFKEEAATVAVFRGESVANTLLRHGEAYSAANTDRVALASMTPLAVPGTRALVLGAGATARTAVEVLISRRYDVSLWSREPVKAHDAAEQLGVGFLANLSESVPRFGLLVNATPVGLKDEDPLPCPEYLLHEEMVVIDAPYRAGGTALARRARERGATVHDGFELLLAQAAKQAELFTGRPTGTLDLLARMPERYRRLFEPADGVEVNA